MLLFIIVVFAAIAFEYINGFHDAANAIATVVSTKVLTPRQAIALAAFFNLTGALMGTAVASTIGKGIVETRVITMATVLCALLAAIIWNLVTWWLGLPSSSSHALIGGLCGSAVASAGGDWSILQWETGLMPKVVVPMFTSPVVGFFLGGILMALLFALLRPFTPHIVHKIFGKMQLVSAAWMAHSHGTNDAQKTMGIIAVLLFSQGMLGGKFHVPFWVVISCQAAMGLGTLLGGWKIVHTMGSKITRLTPAQGFCAETGGAITLFMATHLGVPVSTTHTITGAIVGVGASRRLSAVRWNVASSIIVAWVVTLPAAALIGAAFYELTRLF